MTDFEKIEHEFYEACYPCATSKRRDKNLMWKEIKQNKDLLRWAIGVYKEKYNRDYLQGLTISEYILSDYDSIDEDIYNELVDKVYSYLDIARCKPASHHTLLEMTLWNPNLKLTEEQKALVINEERNQVVYTNGFSEFGLKYWILRNPNWTNEEKYKFIYEFYDDEESYSDILDKWEWDIIDTDQLTQPDYDSKLDKSYLYDYTDEELKSLTASEEAYKEIKELIEFCRLMRTLRPPIWTISEAYNLSEDNVNKMVALRKYLAEEKNEFIDYYELVNRITWAMNCDKMQIWLIRNQINGVETTFDQELTKFFELTSIQRIAVIFDINKNVNEENIKAVKSVVGFNRTRSPQDENK